MRLLLAVLPLALAADQGRCPKSGFDAENAFAPQCPGTQSSACPTIQTFLLFCKTAGYDVVYDENKNCCITNPHECQQGVIPTGTPKERCTFINTAINQQGGDYALVQTECGTGESHFRQWVSMDCDGNPQIPFANGTFYIGKLQINEESRTWLWIGIAAFGGSILLVIANKLY